MKDKIIFFLICLLMSFGIFLFITMPMKGIIDNCEDKGWDGSTYDTGIKEVTLFEKPETIKVKCNKDGNGETDAMIGVLDALYFLEKSND